uniref:Nodulin-20a n=1 Tax=Cajanus cajan TaxID=3821 RepID=A0A151SY05_CAJCA|nr:Nodulin-20a [Cajanus cajan]
MHHDNGGVNLAPCLFDSMERCLVDHGASFYETSSRKPIQYQPILIETIKFRTVLRTCTHVSARSCYTGSNVVASELEACLIPSMNQCVYPDSVKSGMSCFCQLLHSFVFKLYK